MLSSKARPGVTDGSPSAIWMASPSSSADSDTAKSSGSTGPNSPASCPASTCAMIVSRQRSSNFCRTPATSGSRTDWAHRSSHSSQDPAVCVSASGRQVIATSSSRRPAALGMAAIRAVPASYQVSSAYRSASVSSWSLVLK